MTGFLGTLAHGDVDTNSLRQMDLALIRVSSPWVPLLFYFYPTFFVLRPWPYIQRHNLQI